MMMMRRILYPPFFLRLFYFIFNLSWYLLRAGSALALISKSVTIGLFRSHNFDWNHKCLPIIKNIIAATTSNVHDSAWNLLKAWFEWDFSKGKVQNTTIVSTFQFEKISEWNYKYNRFILRFSTLCRKINYK